MVKGEKGNSLDKLGNLKQVQRKKMKKGEKKRGLLLLEQVEAKDRRSSGKLQREKSKEDKQRTAKRSCKDGSKRDRQLWEAARMGAK